MINRRLLIFFILLIILSPNVFAQNPADINTKIRSQIESRDYASVISELQNLKAGNNKIFTLNNYDYLLARMAERNENYALAAANYEAVVKRNSILSEYALWHLSQIARSSGNLMLEKIYLRQLLTVAPGSLLKNAAGGRLMRSNFESKNFESVVNNEWQIVNESKDSSQTTNGQQSLKDRIAKIKDRETLVYLGQSYLQLGKTDEAREIFSALMKNLPNAAQPDDFALAGAEGLDEIEAGRENFGKTAPQISDGEHYRRAFIYQFNRNFPLARLHYQAIVENFPQSTFAPDSMYQIGRGYAQEENFEEAVKWFERVSAEFSLQPIARDALSQAASAYSRLNKPKEAIARYKQFIEKYSDADNLNRAYLNIVDIKRDSGEDTEALNWAAKTREAFKGQLPEAVAIFAQARIHIAQSDWTSALNDLNELQTFPDLGGTRVPGGTNKTEIEFLKAFVLENLERYSEAIDAYLAIPDGRNQYYGWRSTVKLRALATNEKSAQIVQQKFNQLSAALSQTITTQSAETIRQSAQSALRLTNDEAVKNQLLQIIRKVYALIPVYQKIPAANLIEFGRKEVLTESKPIQTAYHQTLANELLFLNLYDEGAPELEAGLSEPANAFSNANPKSNDLAYTLAVYYNRGDMSYRAVSYIEPLWRNIPDDYQIELIPIEQIKLLYPTPYSDSLLRYASTRNVDPRFALSIMRQESRFKADVKSNAAARGLMQFISTTSDRLAVELGRNDFEQDDLYNPPTAILFGSQYLANLFRQFPDQPQAVAASYNGGETNMERWMARSKGSIPDRYVPEILFTQSKDYVYKVMANYRVYQTFYDAKLKGNQGN